MSAEVKTKTELALSGTAVDHLETAAQQDAGYAELLKFKKGEFFIGDELIPLGSEYLAHAIGWTKSWVKFVDGEVVERKTYRVAKGEQPPEREELGDDDKDAWPEGLDGKPSDPWSLQYLLPLEKIHSGGDLVIFTTSSFGGRRAVADLCSTYVKRMKKNADCGQPIVKLSKVDMPTKKFGKVPRPDFQIIGWDEPSQDIDVLPPDKGGNGGGGKFDDEIPFAPCI